MQTVLRYFTVDFVCSKRSQFNL